MSTAEERRRARRARLRIRRPPVHWWMLGVCVLLLLVALLVQGVTVRTIGASGTPAEPETDAAPAVTGPVLQAHDGTLTPRQRPMGRRIALTFDDGPDATWTPRIAATLRRLRVPGTFFMVGGEISRHADVARRLHDDGFELGTHTFTHADVTAVDGWRRSLQMDLTDSAISGAVGVRSRLFRPPYSSTPTAVTTPVERAYAEAATPSRLVVLSDLDSRDWTRPGVGRIVDNATPKGRTGGIVLLHDGGGDRRQTLAAIPRLVSRLRARGFRFTTVAELARLPRDQAEVPSSRSERTRGRLLLAALAVARFITDTLNAILIPIAALMLLRALILVLLAQHHKRRTRTTQEDAPLPPVSVIVPAYNEAVGIERAVRSLSTTTHPEVEIIVVDDGSIDGTGDIVERLGLPSVRVVRQVNAGKAAALERGIRMARCEVIVMVDGDTVFEPDTLVRLVRPLQRDETIGAVSGNTKVGNRHGLLGRWQHIEYVMGFNLDRRLYDVLRCMPTVPGAIGAFRRRALADVGGLSTATLAEDTDLTIALGRAGWRVVYEESARAWTEAPATLSSLWRQRYRWSYGTMQAVWKHKAAIVRRDEGPVGRRGLPYLVLFQVLLPALAPLIDVFAIYGVVFLDPVPVLAYWIGFNVVQLLLGAYAFRLDGESLRPLWAMPLQQFVYRQLMYLVVIESVFSALIGTRLRWQHLERTGDVEVGS